jgi:hypothetical protein
VKRIRIASGKHVIISAELAEKAARVFANGLTREKALDLIVHEPRHATGLMVGSKKPLALAKPRGTARGKVQSDASPNESFGADAPCSRSGRAKCGRR